MEKGKTTGMGGIPVKVWKCLGEEGRTDLAWDLMQRIYEQEKIPTGWIDSVVYLFIKQGRRKRCGQYGHGRTISI